MAQDYGEFRAHWPVVASAAIGVGVGIAPPAFGRVFDVCGNYDPALSVALGALGLGVVAIATLGKAPKF